MGPSPLHRGREARASPQSPEAQGLWKVLPWDLGRDSGRMVFTGRAAGVGGAAAPTSCQNKDQDSECWVCPLWAAWYAPPSPNQGKATMRDRCAQVMVLQQPSWMCLPSRRPHATKPPCRVSCLDTGAMPSSHSTLFPARQTSPFVTTFSLGTKMRSHLEPDGQKQVYGSGERNWA